VRIVAEMEDALILVVVEYAQRAEERDITTNLDTWMRLLDTKK